MFSLARKTQMCQPAVNFVKQSVRFGGGGPRQFQVQAPKTQGYGNAVKVFVFWTKVRLLRYFVFQQVLLFLNHFHFFSSTSSSENSDSRLSDS